MPKVGTTSGRILILGEINSGKTGYTLELLRLVQRDRKAGIAVLDLAPERTSGVGGRLVLPRGMEHAYYTDYIVPPRLSSDDPAQQWALAEGNLERIEGLFAEYLQYPREILVVNDVTMYLHAGSVERLLRVVSGSELAIINGYYGSFLGESPLSKREREKMEELIRRCEVVKWL